MRFGTLELLRASHSLNEWLASVVHTGTSEETGLSANSTRTAACFDGCVSICLPQSASNSKSPLNWELVCC